MKLWWITMFMINTWSINAISAQIKTMFNRLRWRNADGHSYVKTQILHILIGYIHPLSIKYWLQSATQSISLPGVCTMVTTRVQCPVSVASWGGYYWLKLMWHVIPWVVFPFHTKILGKYSFKTNIIWTRFNWLYITICTKFIHTNLM